MQSNVGNCALLTQTKDELDALLPPLTLTFKSATGQEMSAQAAATESYLYQIQGEWCQAMCGTTLDPIASIMGAAVLRSNVVIFDRVNNQVGFAPHKPCN
jgi:hypothetical protein